jgi:hypothetical protein
MATGAGVALTLERPIHHHPRVAGLGVGHIESAVSDVEPKSCSFAMAVILTAGTVNKLFRSCKEALT